MAEPAKLQVVSIPDVLRDLLLERISERDLSAWAVEALVVEAVREHIISRRKAATLLGLADHRSRQEFFERHQLSNEYTQDMVREDFETIDQAS